MTEKLWCSNCSTVRYHFGHTDEATCRECDSSLSELPRRVFYLSKAKEVALTALGIGIFVMPVAWLLLNLGQEPLYATETVTVEQTRPYGIIPSMAPAVFLWILIGIIYYAMAVMPRVR